MSIITYIICTFVLVFLLCFTRNYSFVEPFADQTIVPQSQQANHNWSFQSPKSNIRNFNETTYINQGLNELKPYNSGTIDKIQLKPLLIYPYTYINREFDHILITICHQIEKDYNQYMRLNERNNQEWNKEYPYQLLDWNAPDYGVHKCILVIINEINRRFNIDQPIVGVKNNNIQYHWIKPNRELIVQLKVYKKYTFDDVKYYDGFDKNVNQHLKSDFEKDLIVYFDNINDDGGVHIKYVRFPSIDYENDDTWDDKTYINETDQYFYLALSRQPMYRMLQNTEARDIYINKLKKDADTTKYTCFPRQLNARDRSTCETMHGIWDKKCETNTDCPYYQANQNYPNKYGGCDTQTGYCQFPIGVVPLTYHKPDNPHEAYCYNCNNGFLGPKSVGQCCNQQDKPDYMFTDDISIRRENQDILKQKNLLWSSYI